MQGLRHVMGVTLHGKDAKAIFKTWFVILAEDEHFRFWFFWPNFKQLLHAFIRCPTWQNDKVSKSNVENWAPSSPKINIILMF